MFALVKDYDPSAADMVSCRELHMNCHCFRFKKSISRCRMVRLAKIVFSQSHMLENDPSAAGKLIVLLVGTWRWPRARRSVTRNFECP